MNVPEKLYFLEDSVLIACTRYGNTFTGEIFTKSVGMTISP